MTGVTLDVVDQQGNVMQSQALNYLWHPMISHYGNNYKIPDAGTYTLRVRAPAPNFWRHSKELGDRFTQPVDVSFTNVQITPKAAPPEELGTAGAAGAGPSETTPECPPGTVPKKQ
jgi:hypothetical protein